MNHQRIPPAGSRASVVFPDLTSGGVSKAITTRSGAASNKNKSLEFGGQTARRLLGAVKTTVMSYTSMHKYGELFVEFMRMRKKVFIDQLKWDLPEVNGMEFDQYDNPNCLMVAVHEYGEVLAGIRLSPTTSRVGLHSYMIRDAQLGLLENIPDDVLFFKAPVDATIWEATRVFIADSVSAERRPFIQRALVNKMIEAAREQGANSIIGIVPSIYARWLRRLNLDAVPVGPRFKIDGSLCQAILFNTNHSIH